MMSSVDGGRSCRLRLWVALLSAVMLVCFASPASAAAAVALKWSAPRLADRADALSQLSCPSISLCVAIDGAGRIVTSTDPTAPNPTWAVPLTATLAGGAVPNPQLSCPIAALCVASSELPDVGVLLIQDILATSTDPAAGPSAWATSYPFRLLDASSLSCGSARLCVSVAGGGGWLLATTRPTADSLWQETDFVGPVELGTIACDSQSLCVVTDRKAGDIVTSTDPTGGSRAWNSALIDPGHLVLDVACPTDTLCFATDDSKDILWSSDPTGQARAWHRVRLNIPLGQIVCRSVSECVAIGGNSSRDVVSSLDPTGGPRAWTVTTADPGARLTSLSCPSVTVCIAADARGNVVVGTGAGPKRLTRKVIVHALDAALRSACIRHQTAAAILHLGSCHCTFVAPGAGQLTLTLTSTSGATLARAQTEATGTGKLTVPIPLTSAGKQVLREARHTPRIRIQATFLDATESLYRRTATVTLTR